MNLNPLLIKTISANAKLINATSVRNYRRLRKPFWLGRAKTKMFILPKEKVVPLVEENEINKLTENYRILSESVLNFMKLDEVKALEHDADQEILNKKIEESYKRNELWNAECARLREKRLKEAEIELTQKAIKVVEEQEEIKQKKLAIVEEIVKKEQILSKNFITPENLDEALEKCLDNVICYDFAIDLKGNRYEGRESLKQGHTDKVENIQKTVRSEVGVENNVV